MSDELLKLKEMIRKLEGKIAELMEKNNKLEEGIETLKAENLQLKNLTETESTVVNQTSQPMEGEIPKSKRFFKNWLLFDTLPWIDRKELANSSMSTASETFRQLCWPKLHENVKPHKIRYLRISPAHMELGNFRALVQLGRGEIIPIASIPPLDYILGIEQIELNFLNDEVVNFLKSIKNLLQNCKLEMSILSKKHVNSVRTLMDFLANVSFILRIGWQPNVLRLNDINVFFPGFINEVQFIQFCGFPNTDEIDTIMSWLTKEEANNEKQKIIIGIGAIFGSQFMSMATFINRIKEEFSYSNSPSIFLIDFATKQNEEFTLENVRTNEILTLYRKNVRVNYGWNNFEYSNYYLARYPKGEEHWKEDGENKIREYQMEDSTSISINIA